MRERLGAAYGVSTSLQPVDLETARSSFALRWPTRRPKGARGDPRGICPFIAEGVTDEELEALKRLFVTSHRDRLRRAPSVAANVLTQVLHHFPDEYLASYEGRVGRYDRTAVNTICARPFPSSH